MLVIADTSPLNYLILIDAADLLPRLYQRVVLPQAAWEELKHPCAPAAVSRWTDSLPACIEIRQAPDAAHADPSLESLGNGEREAIARSLAITDTLRILRSAAAEGWIDLAQAFERLRQTNFCVSERLLQELLDGR